MADNDYEHPKFSGKPFSPEPTRLGTLEPRPKPTPLQPLRSQDMQTPMYQEAGSPAEPESEVQRPNAASSWARLRKPHVDHSQLSELRRLLHQKREAEEAQKYGPPADLAPDALPNNEKGFEKPSYDEPRTTSDDKFAMPYADSPSDRGCAITLLASTAWTRCWTWPSIPAARSRARTAYNSALRFVDRVTMTQGRSKGFGET